MVDTNTIKINLNEIFGENLPVVEVEYSISDGEIEVLSMSDCDYLVNDYPLELYEAVVDELKFIIDIF